MDNRLLTIRWDRLRVGQRDAINTINEAIRAGHNSVAIVLPPGYGKSDVMRVSGVMLMLQRLVSRALILEPAETLRHQIVDRQKMQEASDRYNLPPILGAGIQTYEATSAPTPPFPPVRHANAAFISMSIQMANNNRHHLVRWVHTEIGQRGIPPVIFVDEAHTGSHENEWGATVRVLREAGAFTVLLTGTPFRADRQRIEGFNWEEGPTEQIRIYRPQQETDGERLVDIYEGQRTLLHLKPDYEYSMRNAWDVDDPPSLCKITRLPLDFDLSNYAEVSQEYRGSNTLSQLSQSQLRGKLGELLRHDSVIEAFCRSLAEQLRNRKRGFSESAAIVFVGNDRPEAGEEDNHHARLVANALGAITNEFQCVIATSATANGIRELRRFQEGQGDVLIVKQMGAVGYDVPRLKVCVDLSVVRSATAYVQRICRIARVCRAGESDRDMQLTATYITPDDLIGLALWQNFIAAEGGETFLTNAEYVETKIAEGQEAREREYWVLDAVRPGDIYSDTDRKVSPRDTLTPVMRLVTEVPILERVMTLPEVEKNLDAFRRGLGIEDDKPTQNSQQPSSSQDNEKDEPLVENNAIIEDGNESYKLVQSELKRLALMLAEKRLNRGYVRGDPAFREMLARVQFAAKLDCGIQRKRPRDYTEQDIENLRAYYDRELAA